VEVAESSIQSPVNRLTRCFLSIKCNKSLYIEPHFYLRTELKIHSLYQGFYHKKSEFQINVLFKLKFKANVAVFVGAIHTAVYLMTEGADS
jgi:hypothetical protein